MNVLQEAGKALQRLRQQRPLIHHITNVVTINDCANATLAIGASPTMTWAPAEAGEMAGAASALVLNMGTLQPWTIDAMEKAGKAAAGQGVPIVLDPCRCRRDDVPDAGSHAAGDTFASGRYPGKRQRNDVSRHGKERSQSGRGQS